MKPTLLQLVPKILEINRSVNMRFILPKHVATYLSVACDESKQEWEIN